MKISTVLLGKNGEDSAVQFLKNNGCIILERNYRKRFGEIDIIAKEDHCLVFVEVKTRRSLRCGNPFEAVDLRKQRQISKVALDYITRHGLFETPARFDVVSVTTLKNSPPIIDIIKNAFEFIGPAY